MNWKETPKGPNAPVEVVGQLQLSVTSIAKMVGRHYIASEFCEHKIGLHNFKARRGIT